MTSIDPAIKSMHKLCQGRPRMRSAKTAVLVLIVTLAGAILPLAAPSPADAQSGLRRTSPNHLTPAPRRMDRYEIPESPKHYKPHINPFKAGTIWFANGTFSERSKFERDLSEACRNGRFKRVAGGFADFDDLRVQAAPPRGIQNKARLPLMAPVYFFRYEGTTNCQVYSPR